MRHADVSVPLHPPGLRAGGPDPLYVATAESPHALADRSVFWAELGLVAAPRLLSRIGQALQQQSDADPELREAMCLAAKHVESKCLVWHSAFGPAGVGAHPGAQDSWSCEHLKEDDVWTVRDDAGDPDQSSDGSDSASEQSEALRGSRGIARLIPWPRLLALLPGLGGPTGTVLWATCLTLGALRCVYKAFVGEYWVWLAHSRLSANVARLVRVMIAARLLSYIPLILSVSRMVRSDAFDAAVHAELHTASGGTLRWFMKSKVTGFLLVLSLIMAAQLLSVHGGPEMFLILLVLHIIVVISCAVFIVVWKLSLLRICRLRDRIRSQAADLSGGWPMMTREYQAIVDFVDEVWRRSGFSGAVMLRFGMDLVFVTFVIAGAKVDMALVVRESWLWIIVQVAALCVGLYFWAQIHSVCSSDAYPKQSLLSLAARHLGRLSRQDAVDHQGFMDCVKGLPCGVHIGHAGLVSMRRVGPILRLASVGVPVLIGVAFNIAKKDAPTQ